MKVLPKGFVTIKEVSTQAHACVHTIREDIKKGRLAVYKVPAQKPDLFRREEVEKYIQTYHTPQPKEREICTIK